MPPSCLASSRFALRILHHPSFIPRFASMITGLFNFRDIGGLPTQTGTIRRNRLFCSAQPGQITPEGAESLRQLGITTMFDLRSTVEISNYDFMQVKDMNEIQRVSVPIFTNSDTSQQISKRRNYALGQPVTISFSLPPPPYPSTIHTTILKS